MNRWHDDSRVKANQLRTFERLGLFEVSRADHFSNNEALWQSAASAIANRSARLASGFLAAWRGLKARDLGAGAGPRTSANMEPSAAAKPSNSIMALFIEIARLPFSAIGRANRQYHEAVRKEAAKTQILSRGPRDLPALVDPADERAPLELRARSYLHANCAHCHVAAGGGNSAIELGFNTPLQKTNLVGVRPLHDRFGIEQALLIAPGSPDHSVLIARMMRRGRGQMPPLASALPDEQGLSMLRRWIEQLSATEKSAAGTEQPQGAP
jgi:mono/diheme cytochrome c family protein